MEPVVEEHPVVFPVQIPDPVLPDIPGRVFEPSVSGREIDEVEKPREKFRLLQATGPVDLLCADRIYDVSAGDLRDLHLHLASATRGGTSWTKDITVESRAAIPKGRCPVPRCATIGTATCGRRSMNERIEMIEREPIPDCDRLRTLEYASAPDPRSLAWVVMDQTAGLRPMSIEDRWNSLTTVGLHEGVPRS